MTSRIGGKLMLVGTHYGRSGSPDPGSRAFEKKLGVGDLFIPTRASRIRPQAWYRR